MICPECNGTGRIVLFTSSKPCPACHPTINLAQSIVLTGFVNRGAWTVPDLKVQKIEIKHSSLTSVDIEILYGF